MGRTGGLRRFGVRSIPVPADELKVIAWKPGRGPAVPLPLAVAGAIGVLSVLANLLPGLGVDARSLVFVASQTLSTGFVLLSVRRVPAGLRLPFRLAGWNCVLWVAGSVVFGIYESRWPDVFPTPADPLLIGGYVPLVLAFWHLNRRRRRTFGSLLDAAIVTTSAAILSVVFLVLPKIQDEQLSIAARVVGSIYPLLDVLLLFLIAQVLITPGARSPSLWWLTAAMASTLSGDLIQNTVVLRGTTAYPPIGYAMWSLFYILLAISAIHAADQSPSPSGDHRSSAEAGLTIGRCWCWRWPRCCRRA